jgi:hypothetical protein
MPEPGDLEYRCGGEIIRSESDKPFKFSGVFIHAGYPERSRVLRTAPQVSLTGHISPGTLHFSAIIDHSSAKVRNKNVSNASQRNP